MLIALCASAFSARACRMSAFNVCESWIMHVSAARLHLMQASALKGFELAQTHQIIGQGRAKTVIADEPCYIRAF